MAKEHLQNRMQCWSFMFWAFPWLLVYLRVNRSTVTAASPSDCCRCFKPT